VNADGSTRYKDHATAKFSDGRLIVAGTSGARGGGTFERVLIKDPRGPDPIPVKVSVLPKSRPSVPGNTARRNTDGADGLLYIQPGPWKSTLAEKDVIGVWLGFGVGAPKQFFIIKKVGDRLRGMVCGTCDNPYTMAALDDFRIEGDAAVQHPPRGLGRRRDPDVRQARHGARGLERDAGNDCRRSSAPTATASPARRLRPGILLVGPIPIEATSGNVWPEWPPKNTSSPR
jgi:hypothetical protein